MSLGQRADRLLQDAASRGDVPGVVAAATTANDTIYEGGFGERVLRSGVAMTPETVVWIASMTKAITAAAAMQLVEQGKLDLDRPAGTVVAHLGEVEVLEGFDDVGQPVTRPPRQAVTLRHLLTHTAGYAYEMWNPDVVRYHTAKGLPQIVTCQNAALDTPLLFDPGDRWEYGINLDWVGKMVEAVSGQTLGQYMKAHILDPLGMHDTAFTITPTMDARLAKIRARGADDSLAPIDLVMEQSPEFEMGGGGLYSTVGDFVKFIRMILNKGAAGGRRVLQPETVAEMSVNQMGACRVCKLTTVMPEFSADAEFFPGMEKTWGLSFMINTELAPTGRAAGSLAWAGLANSCYWIDATNGIGGVYLSQILPFGDEKSLSLYLEFERTVYENR